MKMYNKILQLHMILKKSPYHYNDFREHGKTAILSDIHNSDLTNNYTIF